MATTTVLDTGQNTNNTATYTSNVGATPAAGTLIVSVWAHSCGTAGTPTLTDQQGLGHTLITTATQSATNKIYMFVANAFAANSANQLTFTPNSTSPTGIAWIYWTVSGMSRVGPSAIRGSAVQDAGGTGTTPAPVFAVGPKTANNVYGAVMNVTNPATLTPPSTWTEDLDTGYLTPTIGFEAVHKDTGFTATTVTWGGTSPSAFGALVFELDTFPSIPDVIMSPIRYG